MVGVGERRIVSQRVIASERAAAPTAAAELRIEYARHAPHAPLPPDTLAAVTFGAAALPDSDPRRVRVPLAMLAGDGACELWRAVGPVELGRAGPIRFAADAEYLAGVIELDEREYAGLAGTAEAAYTLIRHFQRNSSHPHLLRIWNYFDGINAGADDAERYKQFCLGRAAGLAAYPSHRYPAATAIGRRDGSPVLQILFLAGSSSGTALENPRQLSAFRYPRRYGPVAPSFSRAMLVPPRLLLISGTASITGHASRHPGRLGEQIDETLRNLASLLARAALERPGTRASSDARTLLKVYLRDAASAGDAAARLAEQLPDAPFLMLEADICRAELLVEIDCVHHFGIRPKS
ncbi:MAG TPA: hypothetical protein VMU67_16050 [Steroidobacteraceae bacterium]|nr:hypothetical protein [Steroidobacteraceae bacterium]